MRVLNIFSNEARFRGDNLMCKIFRGVTQCWARATLFQFAPPFKSLRHCTTATFYQLKFAVPRHCATFKGKKFAPSKYCATEPYHVSCLLQYIMSLVSCLLSHVSCLTSHVFGLTSPVPCLKSLVLTLIKGALEENLQLLFKTILHHDALS